ncbi:MAG: sulfite exporter TauE/SafE family protein [Acidimicrobiia bacterium]
MDAVAVVAASGVMALAASVQGAVGFGSALVGAPLLVLIDPRLVPGPITVASTVLNAWLVLTLPAEHADRSVRWAMVGYVPGAIVAAVVLVLVPRDGLTYLFAGLTLLGVGISAAGTGVRRRPATLASGGTLSGVMGTVSGIGGPPVVLLYRDEPALLLRSTFSRFFLVTGLYTLAVLAVARQFGRHEAYWSLALLPGVVVGLAVGPALARRVDRGSARPWVLGLSGIGATAVVVQQVL